MSDPDDQYTQTHYRYHVYGEIDGVGNMADTATTKAEAVRLASRYAGDYDQVTVYDTMARYGAWCLWRVEQDGSFEGIERRPFA